MNYGIKIVSVTEPSDCDTPYGEFTIGLLGLMSTLERKVMKMRTKMGQRTRVEKGLHHGGLDLLARPKILMYKFVHYTNR